MERNKTGCWRLVAIFLRILFIYLFICERSRMREHKAGGVAEVAAEGEAEGEGEVGSQLRLTD